MRIEGRNKGAEFSRTEQFGQWPLQVNGNRDLHESLEASTAHENFDSCGGAEERDGQERWFTSLPPVLFLELSRFQFDRSRGVAEKVNNALEFPDVIYLDRYLEVNKAVTRGKREQVRRLVERRTALQKELAGYTSYGGPNATSSGDKFPLVSVLQLALDFAKSGGEVSNEAWEGEQAMQVDSPCPSPRGILTPASSVANLAEGSGGGSILPDGSISIPIMREGGNPQQVAATEMEVEQSGEGAGHLAVARCQGPIPRHVSELELKVLSSCLARWSKEVDEEIATLNANLQDIETRIKGMYEEEGLRQRGYRLHAVMVHEGDAQQGHYWAYVHLSGEKRGWLKFNDNTVSQTTWEELSKEAVGGRLSTSAYSCVYVDLARPELVTPEEGGTVTEVQALPPDLDTFILEDNKSFAAEILKWDEDQLLGKKEEPGEAAAGEEASGPAVLIGDDPECQIIMQKSHDFAHGHALLAKEATLETLNAVSNSAMDKQRKEKGGTSAVINKIFQKVKQCIQSPKSEGLDERQDPRLESFLHYLVANEQQGVDLYRRALLEQVSLPEFEQHGELGREVVRTAKEMKQKDGKDDVAEEIGLWHRAYHQFRLVSKAQRYKFLVRAQDCCQLLRAWG